MALNLIQTNAYEVTPVLTVNAQTGTSYTFALSDSVNTLVTAANASAIAVTIPTNATVAFPVGSVLNLAQTGAGQVTISGASGVTITSVGATAATPKTRVQYSVATAIQTTANNWLVTGDIA
jgi:hypothetical protein